MAWRILLSKLRIKLWSLAMNAWSPNHWTMREFPRRERLDTCTQVGCCVNSGVVLPQGKLPRGVRERCLKQISLHHLQRENSPPLTP